MRRAAFAIAAATALVFTLAGCTPPAAEPTAWQRNVQTVAQQASAGDYSTALASLDALEADVTARRDAGEISSDEAQAILTRIATVRADLTALVPAPASTSSPEPSSTQGSAPTEPASSPSTPSATPEPTETAPGGETGDDPSQTGPGDKGPGPNGTGNGNGNGTDKGPGKDGTGPGKKG